jgi:F-type H+-transporting ATPase subunit delta
MATVNDTAIAIADEYVEAALTLAERAGVADAFLTELGDFVAYLRADEAFAKFMESPVIDAEVRRDVLERTLRGKMSDLVLNTVLVLNGKGRSDLIPLFHERFRLALEEQRHEVDVLVTTAHPLTAELRVRLTQILAEHTGRQPVLIEKVDPTLLAGVKVQIEDELLDHSAVNHLRRMRHAFLERASHELHAGRRPFEEGRTGRGKRT